MSKEGTSTILDGFAIGLDISTSVIGVAIANSDGSLHDLRCIDLRKVNGFWNKVDTARSEINMLVSEMRVAEVYVERDMKKFRPGASSASVLMKLAKFNGIVSLLIRSALDGMEPLYVDVNSARKVMGIKTVSEKKCGISRKQQVFDQVSVQIEFDWPTRTLQSGPRKGLVLNDETCYDMADAWVIVTAAKRDENLPQPV